MVPGLPLVLLGLHGTESALEVQIYHLHSDAFTAPSLSMIADGGVNLLPWKTSVLLLPQDDFHCTAGKDKPIRKETSPTKAAKVGSEKDPRRIRGTARRAGSREDASPSGAFASGSFEYVQLKESAERPLEAAFFLKWCRNGRAKKRYVEFDDQMKAIIWKDHAAAKPAGVFPLSNIQDICVGMCTPVAHKAEAPTQICCSRGSGQRLDPNLLISIVADDRTLDLQAATAQQHQHWADGLISRFRSYMENSMEFPGQVPGQVQYRPYPKELRSDRCELRLACERLHSMTSFNSTLQVMQSTAVAPRVCRSCGLPFSTLSCGQDHVGGVLQREAFWQAGKTTWVECFSGKGAGTGGVSYATAEEAANAITMLNGSEGHECQTYFAMGWGGWGKGKDGKGGGGGWSPWQPMFMKWGKGKGFGKADQIAAQY
eukprot:Skav207385  [mRNA]  locus=scaffold2421:782:4917:+ [translate_table: standard]